MMTIREVIQRAARLYGPRPAFADDSRQLTFRQIEEATRNMAAHLARGGVGGHERAGVFLPRSVDAVLAYLGAMRGGVAVFPMNAAMFEGKDHPALNLLKPRFIFCREADETKVLEVARRLPWRCEVFADSSFETTGGTPAGKSEECGAAGPNDIIYYNMTSGTSGVPKFAATSHLNLVRNTQAVLSVFNAAPEDVYLCLFPIDLHPHEHFMRSIMSGCKTVLAESRQPRVIMEMIHQHGVTWLKAAPVMMDLLSAHISRSGAGPAALRWLEISGVTCREQVESWRKTFKGGMFRVWGSTETTGIAFCCDDAGLADHTMLGRVLDGYRAEILDAAGAKAGDGVTGRLVVEGDPLFAGYLAGADGSLAPRPSNLHDTGDLACRDNSGNFYFRGRARGILKIAGRKVFVGAIENMLLSIKGIREAAVVGAADRKREDVALAFVSLENSVSLSEHDVIRLCRQGRSDTPAPDRVFFLRRLPLTPGGKTDYVRLKEQFEEGRDALGIQ